jgi:ABC-2 type transport system ATP-binding protein
LVQVDHLTKDYGSVRALDGVSFDAREGEIVAFLGRNGAGKTTAMRIMTGFMAPTSGTVRINGADIREDPLAAKRQIGYLPETAPLYEDMSVQHYLAFCARIRKVPRGEVAERVEAAMEAVQVSDRRAWLIGKLSKGLRRRVGLAQALVHRPGVLILDEPTEGLDPGQIIGIRNLIRGLRGDHTVILSTHILPEAQAMADRVVIIEAGRIVAVDTTENLTAAVRGARRLVLEVDGPASLVRDAVAGVPGVTAVQVRDEGPLRLAVETQPEADVRRDLADLVIHSGWGLLRLEEREPTLEDVFLHLTGVRIHEEPPREEAGEAPVVGAADAGSVSPDGATDESPLPAAEPSPDEAGQDAMEIDAGEAETAEARS